MCGRYAVTLPPEAMRQAFAYREQPNFPPRYNIAPTQPVPVVRLEQGTRQFILMRWGFIPGWVKDPKDFPLVINIRSESAAEKPSFRAALARRRCLMPADGFYEWHRLGEGRRQENRPYLFRRPDRGFFAFAALWETWHSPDGSEIDTVAMVTGPANGQMAAIHHRSPVILAPEAYDAWLDPASEPAALRPLLRPPPDDFLEMIRLGDAVNKVANDGPELQQPFDPASAPQPPEQKPAMRSRRGGKDDAQGSLF
ncbi:MAG TPA: SOS response-associated peptidase [Bosea sp. (in: a-proteobacteria)]|jgi:putative SOS response-associated peptidase YedK|uniref:SOS response-associated peptidase n=1 Tax=Bosea sp. (in: a-proteobacteria) TaxID=1871050 RepID=UPI002E1085F6|nr:SOS response-associated peptidase [Bosea sp. (in: a-proteobacteria)]